MAVTLAQMTAAAKDLSRGMVRTYRYPLHPTTAQAREMRRYLGVCCEIYNAALQERVDAWEKSQKRIRRFDQTKQLAELNKLNADVASVPSDVLRSAISRVERGFRDFFRRCAAGAKPGHPRFRSRQRYRSFSFPLVKIIAGRIHVPRLGQIKFNQYRPLGGTPLSVTIGYEPTGKWYVAIPCDMGPPPPKVVVRSATGIDLGLTAFATLSDGTEIPNPRHAKCAEKAIARLRVTMARRVRGSTSYDRSRRYFAKLSDRVVNQKKDFNYKLCKQLLSKYDLIAHEHLSIKGMIQGMLGKHVRDVAWGNFLQCLTNKAESAGKYVIAVDSRGTSQRCSACGFVVKKELAERTHRCRCGLVLGRDHNAARNILALGQSVVEAEKFSAVESEGSRRSIAPRTSAMSSLRQC